MIPYLCEQVPKTGTIMDWTRVNTVNFSVPKIRPVRYRFRLTVALVGRFSAHKYVFTTLLKRNLEKATSVNHDNSKVV